MEVDDAEAIYEMGCCYFEGSRGLPQDHVKALELWHRAGKLGKAKSHYSIGAAYNRGEGVERDEKKANHYYELAAMGGHITARHNLGVLEGRAGNMDSAAGFGCTRSLELIKHMIMNVDATKDDYTKALRSRQTYLDEIKSDQRDEAAALNEQFKYCN